MGGACLQHMLLGRVPKGQRDLPKGLSDDAVDLLEDLLQKDPKDRPTIEELLWHPLVAGDTPVVSSIWRTISNITDLMQVPSPSNQIKGKAEMICGFRPF